MGTNEISGSMLKEMIISGAHSLEKNKEIVDQLNVFPVPDGDTGTNMSLTMQSAMKEVKAVKNEDIEEIAEAAANGSLMGARGNSGVILSQLLRGFAKGVKGKETLNTEDLANALKLGADTAYKAVMKPVEGTILTVARESAEYAVKIAKKETDIEDFLEKVIYQGENTLKRTPEMLAVLKEAGVVDSGGKGLIYIYLGILGVLKGEILSSEDLDIMQKTVEHDHDMHVSGDIEFAYCTEFIINTEGADPVAFREKIQHQGDSMLVVGNENLIKVHLHTNHPGEVMEEAMALGELSDIKIDNMRVQYRDKHPEKNTEEEKDFGFITVSIGEGIEKIFRDFNVDHVIKGGQTMNPSTEDFMKAIEEIQAKNIYILPNNSNIIMAANQAKELAKKNVMVIPTKTIPQGITAMIGFNPGNSPEENLREMTEIMEDIETGQVTYAVRDTVVNDKKIKKGNILGIGNGKIEAVGRNVEKVSLELLENLVTEDHEIITLFYGEEVEEKSADKLREKIEKAYPDCEVEIYYGGQPLYYYLFSVE